MGRKGSMTVRTVKSTRKMPSVILLAVFLGNGCAHFLHSDPDEGPPIKADTWQRDQGPGWPDSFPYRGNYWSWDDDQRNRRWGAHH